MKSRTKVNPPGTCLPCWLIGLHITCNDDGTCPRCTPKPPGPAAFTFKSLDPSWPMIGTAGPGRPTQWKANVPHLAACTCPKCKRQRQAARPGVKTISGHRLTLAGPVLLIHPLAPFCYPIAATYPPTAAELRQAAALAKLLAR